MYGSGSIISSKCRFLCTHFLFFYTVTSSCIVDLTTKFQHEEKVFFFNLFKIVFLLLSSKSLIHKIYIIFYFWSDDCERMKKWNKIDIKMQAKWQLNNVILLLGKFSLFLHGEITLALDERVFLEKFDDGKLTVKSWSMP